MPDEGIGNRESGIEERPEGAAEQCGGVPTTALPAGSENGGAPEVLTTVATGVLPSGMVDVAAGGIRAERLPPPRTPAVLREYCIDVSVGARVTVKAFGPGDAMALVSTVRLREPMPPVSIGAEVVAFEVTSQSAYLGGLQVPTPVAVAET